MVPPGPAGTPPGPTVTFPPVLSNPPSLVVDGSTAPTDVPVPFVSVDGDFRSGFPVKSETPG